MDDFKFSYKEFGDANGSPVFYFHGLPGSRIEPTSAHPFALNLGIRLIALDRFGYGDAEYQNGCDYQCWSAYLLKVADQLKIPEFSILGFSLGGSYALACAHDLDERVSKISIVSSLADFSTRVMQDHYSPGFKPLFDLAAADFHAALELVSQSFPNPQILIQSIHSVLSASDLELFEQPSFYQDFLENITFAYRLGVIGAVNDLSCQGSSWPFDIKDIKVPVSVWHGYEDKLCGIEVAQYLVKNLPEATPNFLVDQGHYLLFNNWHKILHDLKT